MKLNANLVSHSIIGQLKADDDRMQLTLSLESLNCLMEHEHGRELGTFHSHPIFQLADRTIEYLQEADVLQFNRTGLRFWILIEHPDFGFEALRNHLVAKISFLESSASKANFARTDDLAITLESGNEEGLFLRTTLGPYQQSEQKRYFSISHSIKEALMVDVDVWQQGIEVPGFRLTRAANAWEQLVIGLVDRINETIREELG